ncbi:hypothetical protein SBADM41S_03919 [Streptomyces badius]
MCAMSATRTAPVSRAISAEAREVDRAGMARTAAEDEPGPLGEGQVADLVQVDQAGVPAYPVPDAAEPAPGGRDVPAVREVAAHRQGHAEDGVTGLKEGQVGGEVGRGAGVRLDVGMVHPEEGLGAADRQCLDLVDDLLALVVPLAGVALGVLVLEHGARGFEHGGGDVVLAGDQAQGIGLEPLLRADQGGQFGVGRDEGRVAGRGGGGADGGPGGHGRSLPGRPRQAAWTRMPRRTALRR